MNLINDAADIFIFIISPDSMASMICQQEVAYARQNNKHLLPVIHREVDVLARYCEEHGVRLERKHPAYTSQYCHVCNRWNRRNRRGDRFKCVHCGYAAHADHNAAYNLELLGLAGTYGLRSLQSLG